MKEFYLPAKPDAAGHCIWTLSKEFQENKGLAALGLLQSYLSSGNVKICLIDLTNVVWADPQPLLSLGLILAESGLQRECIKIELGAAEGDPGHATFLKFFAEQGFLSAFSNYAIFLIQGNQQKDSAELTRLLASQSQNTHLKDAKCIFARIERIDNFHKEPDKLQKLVEKLIKEAQDQVIESAFGKHPLRRDMLFQKLRKLLFELLLNISEHSHAENTPVYAGIYARVRAAKPLDEEAAKSWLDTFDKHLSYGQSQFMPNHYSEWLELFICDTGKGLLSDIQQWKEPNDKEVAKALKKAKQAKNPLESIAVHLFRHALSRHDRNTEERTAVTGLQHLGHLLAIGNDYCSIYTQEGSWVGGHFPWNLAAYSRKNIQDDKNAYTGYKPVSGTAYSFSIQPNHYNLAPYINLWAEPNEEARQVIRSALEKQTACILSHVVFYERRSENHCTPPTYPEIAKNAPIVVVVRPPRLMSKQDFDRWLTLIAGNPKDANVWPLKAFILADLTPFQLLTFRELLLGIKKVFKEAALIVYLVSEHWAVSAFTVSEYGQFLEAKDKAQSFLNSNDPELPFSAAQLAVLLRQKDSELFWQNDTDDKQHFLSFFNQPVIWHDSLEKNNRIKLTRYLDFPHALADPSRYRACRRALRRCLALFPNHPVIGADKLISGLVNDAKSGAYIERDEIACKSNPKVIVGSVAVTAKTVIQQKNNDSFSIHMMVHSDAPLKQDDTSLIALLWKTELENMQLSLASPERRDAIKPWQRIPNTPFIAEYGERSISLLRYQRDADNRLKFDNPYYPRTPEQTYHDFQRLNILKTGHWRYGRRHDLITINSKQAFYASFLEQGPLYIWMKQQFEHLFVKENTVEARAQLLIYPSHAFTDIMLDRIRQDDGFKWKLPEYGMIPVKLLGTRTVSPILVSPLVAHQIKTRTNEKPWAAVIFDDGAVSGKHLRELKTFLQGLGAKAVYTLVFIDRTGQPAEEAVLIKFFDKNKRFWRWDVPALGNQRDCLLCQGLAIAETYRNKFNSPRQTDRLAEWIDIWKVRDVETEWGDIKMLQSPIPEGLEITFGVNESSQDEKHLKPCDSTAATAILMELTRLTTRADVTMKKAKQLEDINPDAAIEMIASQLLLYLDELTPQEQKERFIKLLDLIWQRTNVTEATSLAGLCFTFADREIIKEVWGYCHSILLPQKELGNLDAILATNILCSRNKFATKLDYKLPENCSENALHNFIKLGRGNSPQVIREFLVTLCRNPLSHNDISIHSTEIKRRLERLSQTDAEKITTNEIENVRQDMQNVEQILTEINEQHIAKVPDLTIFQAHINNLKNTEDTDIKASAIRIYEFLYGNGNASGLIKVTAEMFLLHAEKIENLDDQLIGVCRRNVLSEWGKIVIDKNKTRKIKRWVKPDGIGIIEPIIIQSENPTIEHRWVFCNSFVKELLFDLFSNVFHTQLEKIDKNSLGEYVPPKEIIDPLLPADDLSKTTAHLWWRIGIEGDYVIFETANASDKKEATLQQTINIAGFEGAGGKVEFTVNEYPNDQFIAHTKVWLPCHTLYLKGAAL